MALGLKSTIKYFGLFLIGIGVLYLAFKGQDLSKIWFEIKHSNLYWVSVSALCVLIAHILRALRWQMLYQSINYKISFWNTYHALIIGYLANLALPRFGEIGRCSVLLKAEKVPMSASIGTVITERLIDMGILLLIALLMLVFQYHLVSDFLYSTIYLGLINKLNQINFLLLIAILIIAAIGFIFIIGYIKRRINKKFFRIIVGLKQGFNSITQVKNKLLFALYTIGIWCFYCLSMYLCFNALTATQHLDFSAAFTALVFSSFAMVAPVQGGIGIFHWMVAQSLILYAIPFNDGLAYATIIHSAQILITLVLGTVSLTCILYKKSA